MKNLVCRCSFTMSYTSVNFLSQAYFILFIRPKVENQLKSTCGFLTYPTTVLLITESRQCYRSGSVNILCECDMLISWGNNIWLADRRFLIKRLIGNDLNWGHELWPDVDILDIWHRPMFYYCTVLLVHTFLYFTWCFISTLKTIMTMFKFTWRNLKTSVVTCERILYFTSHYKATIQDSMKILITSCYKFIWVHVCLKLPK